MAAEAEAAVVEIKKPDRFGLGWRPELATGILTQLEHIDIVEVIADDYFDAPAHKLRALRTLAQQISVTVHGIKLGLASTQRVNSRLLSAMARVVNAIEPSSWSEHLAFVRGGGIEIGHLAAPPRDTLTLEGMAHNLAHATQIVGSAPLLENIATLIDPPGSTLGEQEWLRGVLQIDQQKLLLDLHNLYANARNFDFDAHAVIRALPADRIAAVHLAGGRMLHSGRWLDDHLHPVPEPVYRLLETLGAHATHPLDVILERDGNYPPFAVLLNEIHQARFALAQGRKQQAACMLQVV